jgi:hypothetical protein
MRALTSVGLVFWMLVGWTTAASAQAELTGTFIRYLRVGPNGALVDVPAARSMQYSSAGTAAGATCDLYFPGSPAVGFTVRATPAGGAAAQASNTGSSGLSQITTTSGPTVSGRAIDWAGRWTSGAIDLRVDQRIEYQTGDHHARVTVTLTNGGSVALDDVHYLFSGDPDHAQCNIGSAFDTNNDVLRQFPADTSALATATAGTPAITFGLGSPDARARAHNGGFENTDAAGTWSAPVDAGGALRDEDIGIVFREARIPAGGSTTLVFYLLWGTSTAEVATRLDAAIAADVELTGTFIRYLRVGPDGAMINRAGGIQRSMQYSEAGGTTDASCDVYFPGAPALGFTLAATSGGTTVSGSNVDGITNVTPRSGPHRAGRTVRWTGNWTSGAVSLDVEHVYEYPVAGRVATLTVRLTNRGAGALTNVHYFFSGDPDFGSCNIGTSTNTDNDVLRQRPADGWAIATATGGETTRYVLGLGSNDVRARANNGGFGNTNAAAAFSTPVDSNNASLDEDIGLVFREATLAAGASTTFVMSIAWGRTQAEVELRMTGTSGAPNGTACTAGSACASGLCVDGVCCNAACGGGAAGDCQACSVAAGGTVDGTCGPIRGGVVCRAAMAGGCDVAEACDGFGLTCPADTLAVAGTVCRVAASACDAPETCSGTSATCPIDVLASAGTVCRPSAGGCDVPETCSGIGATCPADRFASAGMVCRPAATICDVAESCDGTGAACPGDALAPNGSSCDDGVACNGAEVCMMGACLPGMAILCDDGDACTNDTCDEPAGTCRNTPISGCGGTDAGMGTLDDAGMGTLDDAGMGTLDDAGMGTFVDTGAADVGPVDADGVSAVDAGRRRTSGGDCACRAAGHGGPAPASLLVVLGLITLALGRRRRA